MKIRKLLELYKELRKLRKKVRALEDDLAYTNSKYSILYKDYVVLFRNKAQDVQSAHCDRLSLMIPQRCAYSSSYVPVSVQKDVHDKINARMKIKFIDDLLGQGYIKCVHYDDISEVYEMQVVKQNNNC